MNDQRCRKCTVPFCTAPTFKGPHCIYIRQQAGLGIPLSNLEHIHGMGKQEMAKAIVFFLDKVANGFQPSLSEEEWLAFLEDMYDESWKSPEEKPKRDENAIMATAKSAVISFLSYLEALRKG